MANLAANNPVAKKRLETISQNRLEGMSYSEIAKIHGITKGTVCKILHKDQAKAILEEGLSNMIFQVPKAVDVHNRAMDCSDGKGKPTALALKAGENILKTTSIMPGNVTNQTINNIYNIQNNNILSPGVSKALTGTSLQDDPDTIEADYQEVNNEQEPMQEKTTV